MNNNFLKLCCVNLLIILSVFTNLLYCQRPEHIEVVRGDCPAGSVKIGRECVVSVGRICSGADDCIGGFCMENYQEKYCTQLCNYDLDCPPGYFCSKIGENKLCVKSIYSRTICSTDTECRPCGMCINGLCELSTFCVVTLCEDDSDCGSCRVCKDGKCEPIERCGRSCMSDMDCDSNQICDRDYQGRLACIPKIPAETGMYCEGKDVEKECKSGLCLFTDGYAYSYCSRLCLGDSDCPYDYYCGIFPTYPDKKVCIRKGIYRPVECSSSKDCSYDLKCRYSFTSDKNGITTFCGILNNKAISMNYCDRYYECRWGMCGRPEYCKDSCRSLCSMPCEEDLDCPEGFVCEDMLSNEWNLPYRGCVNYRELKKVIGEFCTYSDDECRESICVKNSDIPYCSKRCLDSADCPSDFVCKALDDRLVCQREVSLSECYSDADCVAGHFCSFVEDGSDKTIKCFMPSGDYSLPGESCLNYCTSGICLYETMTCSAFCKTKDDCPSDHICVFASLNKNLSDSVVVKLCIPDPGSLYQCLRSEGCPNNEVCRLFFDQRSGEIEPVCMKLHSKLKEYGELCNANEECSSGVCLPDSKIDVSNGFNGYCTRFCAVDEDCNEEDICRIVPVYFSQEYAKAARVCAPKPKKGEVGQSCSNDPYICDSGFCVVLDNIHSFCTERCRHHYDCKSTLTVCRLIDKIGTICLPVNYFQEE